MGIEIPEGLGNAAMFAIIVGFFQPIVLEFLLQAKWSKRTQSVVAFVFSIVTGSLTAYFAGAFTGLGVVSVVLLVAVSSISAYRGFWKNVTGDLKDKTSIEGPRH